MQLYGIDFTSRPSRRKPITVAVGRLAAPNCVRLDELRALTEFVEFETLLVSPGPWLAACDFPFGLPRELVDAFDWPRDWPGLIRHYVSHDRATLRARFKAFCDARPAGGKFAHRRVDALARSSPSMKWINPPVAWMLLEGAPRLLASGASLPGHHLADPGRIALEAYPALVARAVIGDASYKSDEPTKWTAERQSRRAAIIDALLTGTHPLGIRLDLADPALRARLVADGSADLLDAVLCLVQAAWAAPKADTHYGWPADVDPLEGWILTA